MKSLEGEERCAKGDLAASPEKCDAASLSTGTRQQLSPGWNSLPSGFLKVRRFLARGQAHSVAALDREIYNHTHRSKWKEVDHMQLCLVNSTPYPSVLHL